MEAILHDVYPGFIGANRFLGLMDELLEAVDANLLFPRIMLGVAI